MSNSCISLIHCIVCRQSFHLSQIGQVEVPPPHPSPFLKSVLESLSKSPTLTSLFFYLSIYYILILFGLNTLYNDSTLPHLL